MAARAAAVAMETPEGSWRVEEILEDLGAAALESRDARVLSNVLLCSQFSHALRPATTGEGRGGPTLNTEGPVFDEDGAIADGHYVVSDLILSTPSPGVISVARVTAAGQVTMNGGEITWDGALHIIAPIDGLQEGFQSDFSFTGDVVSSTGPTDIAMSCPVEGGDQPFVFGTVDGRPAVRLIPDDFGVEIEFWFLLQ